MSPPNCIEVELTADEVMRLESDTVDNQGCWVYFDKLVPKEEDAVTQQATSQKKTAPSKGKPTGVPVEEAKPVFARAWLDLTPLLHPGGTHVE